MFRYILIFMFLLTACGISAGDNQTATATLAPASPEPCELLPVEDYMNFGYRIHQSIKDSAMSLGDDPEVVGQEQIHAIAEQAKTELEAHRAEFDQVSHPPCAHNFHAAILRIADAYINYAYNLLDDDPDASITWLAELDDALQLYGLANDELKAEAGISE